MKIVIMADHDELGLTVGTRSAATGQETPTTRIEPGKPFHITVPSGHYLFAVPEAGGDHIAAHESTVKPYNPDADEDDDEDPEVREQGDATQLVDPKAAGPAGSGVTAVTGAEGAGTALGTEGKTTDNLDGKTPEQLAEEERLRQERESGQGGEGGQGGQEGQSGDKQPVVATDDQVREVVAAKGDAIGKTQAGAYKVDEVNAALAEAGYEPIDAATRDRLYPAA